MKIFLTIYLSWNLQIILVSSHGRFIEPPSRASAWRYGFDTPKDYDDTQGFCGGFAYQFQQADGKCGICGDAWLADPAEHEAPGGKFAVGTIVRSYTAGQTIQATIEVTANHAGYFTFKLCANNNVNQDPTQDCFDNTVLRQPNGDDKFTLPNRNTEKFNVDLVLPAGVTCSQCILQWTYRTANSWGTEDGVSCVGCGPQEHFRACADISIGGDGSPQTTTPVIPVPTTTGNVPATTIDSATDAPCTNEVSGNYKRVCYFENWAWYRPGSGKMLPEDIDPSLCTHIMYGFATLDQDTLLLKTYDTWADIDNKFYEKITSFKQFGVKVLIALGGWNDSADDKYSRLVNNESARKKFIENVLKFIEEHNFDGLDLDWEYPRCWQGNCNAGPESDKTMFGVFAKELSAAFKPKGLLLSAAVSAGKSTIEKAYDVPVLGQYLDFINVMTYDFHGSWDKKTGHHSPLYHHPDDANIYINTAYSIDHWMEAGAPREKLIMGMPLYGQSFTLSSSSNHGLNAPAPSPGSKGPFTQQPGFLAYFEICDSVKNEGWTVVGPNEQMGPYAYKDKQWVSYDDKATIRKKSEFIKSSGLGGGMVWAIGLDDFKNRCGDGEYPLLNTIKEVLTGGNDCNPATTPETPQTSVAPQTTTANTNPPPPQTTVQPNPTTTQDNSGTLDCRPTDVYASQPGMVDWCNLVCNAPYFYCPATHCICGGAPIETTTKDNSSPGCRPTDIYASTPGMKEWCINTCTPAYCPSTHCIGCN